MQPSEEQLDSVAQSSRNSRDQLEGSTISAHHSMEEDSGDRREVEQVVDGLDQNRDRDMQTSKEDEEEQVRRSRTSDMTTNGQKCRWVFI